MSGGKTCDVESVQSLRRCKNLQNFYDIINVLQSKMHFKRISTNPTFKNMSYIKLSAELNHALYYLQPNVCLPILFPSILSVEVSFTKLMLSYSSDLYSFLLDYYVEIVFIGFINFISYKIDLDFFFQVYTHFIIYQLIFKFNEKHAIVFSKTS